jgi:hypothetical protein
MEPPAAAFISSTMSSANTRRSATLGPEQVGTPVFRRLPDKTPDHVKPWVSRRRQFEQRATAGLYPWPANRVITVGKFTNAPPRFGVHLHRLGVMLEARRVLCGWA